MNIKRVEELVKEDGVVFLAYGSFLTQSIISGMTETLEDEAQKDSINLGIASNVFTIFIELSQNMMKYTNSLKDISLDSEGLIVVARNKEGSFFIHSQNIILNKHRDSLEPKLALVASLDKQTLKNRYRNLRKVLRDSAQEGTGIGFYEIAKRCDTFLFDFIEIDSETSYFHLSTEIKVKK